jgi:hypothetical protein
MRDPVFMSWRAQMPGRPDIEDPEYLDTPYLTLAVNLCSALGLFIGLWVAVTLLAQLHRGLGRYWWLALILLIDVAVNVTLRVVRASKRRAHPPEPPAKSARQAQRGAQPREIR